MTPNKVTAKRLEGFLAEGGRRSRCQIASIAIRGAALTRRPANLPRGEERLGDHRWPVWRWMQRRSDSNRPCSAFALSVSPRCRVFTYRDSSGTTFITSISGAPSAAGGAAQSGTGASAPWPRSQARWDPEASKKLDALVAEGDYWEMLLPANLRSRRRRCSRWRMSWRCCGGTIRCSCCTRLTASCTTASVMKSRAPGCWTSD